MLAVIDVRGLDPRELVAVSIGGASSGPHERDDSDRPQREKTK